jgi:predicted GIY-YIG superfamily endonuclease
MLFLAITGFRIDTVEVWGSSPHGPTMGTLMAFLYILESLTTGRFYVGSTSDLDRRMEEHARGHSPSTRGRGPWKLAYRESFQA